MSATEVVLYDIIVEMACAPVNPVLHRVSRIFTHSLIPPRSCSSSGCGHRLPIYTKLYTSSKSEIGTLTPLTSTPRHRYCTRILPPTLASSTDNGRSQIYSAYYFASTRNYTAASLSPLVYIYNQQPEWGNRLLHVKLPMLAALHLHIRITNPIPTRD